MDQTLIDQRIAELRIQYPSMFSRGCQPNELLLGEVLKEKVGVVEDMHKRGGIKNLRRQGPFSRATVDGSPIEYYLLYVDAGEYVTALENTKK